jgi:hypothetical protein
MRVATSLSPSTQFTMSVPLRRVEANEIRVAVILRNVRSESYRVISLGRYPFDRSPVIVTQTTSIVLPPALATSRCAAATPVRTRPAL